eukprot:CAMPEP_0176233232 /NCGR_PEP_ID=MMETSP0121_2-20121125/25714_1 /TAXON_ID=160619 /ORGANISM="Kryptoperidinium foliaceum, Strain CCMP 1326" /LENGTH=114 /DNA_ID=CAMNT_0017572611 /DNA_START=40 /DNA_END=384 /DNA_ORIENTATION=+
MAPQKKNASQPVRLYVKGTVLGYKRGFTNTYHHTALLSMENVNDKAGSEFYMGKRVAYIYKAQKAVSGSKFRVIWGKVMRAHGSNGVVRAKFSTNLPSTAIGSSVRVMLYPSNV